jgi:hypothetical protein
VHSVPHTPASHIFHLRPPSCLWVQAAMCLVMCATPCWFGRCTPLLGTCVVVAWLCLGALVWCGCPDVCRCHMPIIQTWVCEWVSKVVSCRPVIGTASVGLPIGGQFRCSCLCDMAPVSFPSGGLPLCHRDCCATAVLPLVHDTLLLLLLHGSGHAPDHPILYTPPHRLALSMSETLFCLVKCMMGLG